MELCFPVLLLLCICGTGDSRWRRCVGSGGCRAPVVQRCGEQALSAEARRAVGGAVERLGLQLLQNLPIGPDRPNVIISPLSLALALAQLALGCRGDTERLLLRALGAHGVPCFHHALGSLTQQLNSSSLQLATRLYLHQDFGVELSFLQDSLRRYGSEPGRLVSAADVNSWVADRTKGHMTNFLDSVPPGVVLMLINAVHFKGEWQTQFDPKSTFPGLFYLEDKSSVLVDMMRSAKYPLSLYEDAELEAQVASFPFKGNTDFLVVVPLPGSGNVSSLVPKLNISDLYRRLPRERSMQVYLPKLHLKYSQELQGALTSMGLGSLFSSPDLSGISDHGSLRVSSVLHASGAELSEEGAEASAATVVMGMRSVSFFAANSPFLFALVDRPSLAPIFLGVVTNPAPDASPAQNDDPLGDDDHLDNGSYGDSAQSDDAPGDNDLQSDEPRRESAAPCSAPSGGEGSPQPPNEVEGHPSIQGKGDGAERCPNLAHTAPA